MWCGIALYGLYTNSFSETFLPDNNGPLGSQLLCRLLKLLLLQNYGLATAYYLSTGAPYLLLSQHAMHACSHALSQTPTGVKILYLAHCYFCDCCETDIVPFISMEVKRATTRKAQSQRKGILRMHQFLYGMETQLELRYTFE